MDMKLQAELRKLQEAAGIKYGSGIYDQIGSTADKPQRQAGVEAASSVTAGASDGVSEEKETVCATNNSDCVTDVDADGYFPETEHGTKAKATGPAAAKMGDNPMMKPAKHIDESLRLVGKKGADGKIAKVYFDAEWDEYQVKLYVNGQHQEEQDYFTHDRDDALSTAQSMAGKSLQHAVYEMKKMAGIDAEKPADDECDDECDDEDAKETVKEAYSSFYTMLQEEFKKANLK